MPKRRVWVRRKGKMCEVKAEVDIGALRKFLQIVGKKAVTPPGDALVKVPGHLRDSQDLADTIMVLSEAGYCISVQEADVAAISTELDVRWKSEGRQNARRRAKPSPKLLH